MNDDEVLLAWLRSRGVVLDLDVDANGVRRPTRLRPNPDGGAVEARHLDMYVSDYMDSGQWISLTLRAPSDDLAVRPLRDAVRLWMLGLYW